MLCAFWATGFVKLLYGCEDMAARIELPPMVKGFGGFALVGLIGVGVPQILGVGYTVMQHVFDRHVPLARAFGLAVLEPVANSVTLAAGGSGGVFGPSLYTGAMLGDAFGRVVHGLFPAWTAAPAAYGLVAMAALFAAAAEAPITAIVIVFEMSERLRDRAAADDRDRGRHRARPAADRRHDRRSHPLPPRHRLEQRAPAARAGRAAGGSGLDTRPFTARGRRRCARSPTGCRPGPTAWWCVSGKRLVGVLATPRLAEWLSREPNAPIRRAAQTVPPTLRGDDSMERAADCSPIRRSASCRCWTTAAPSSAW